MKDTVLNFVQMKNYIIIIFVSSFFITACNGQKKNYMTERQKNLSNEYFNAKKKFDKKYTSHFPNEILIDSSFYLSFDSECKELILENKIIDINSVENLIKQAKAIYKSTDTCLLIIDRFNTAKYIDLTKLTEYDKFLIDRPCYKDKLPVPNFRYSKYADDNTGKLLSGFNLYILDANPGIYFKPNLDDVLDTYMPEYWEHGYSKGVAVNKEKDIVIYWIVIW